jgi:hypothetical protein
MNPKSFEYAAHVKDCQRDERTKRVQWRTLASVNKLLVLCILCTLLALPAKKVKYEDLDWSHEGQVLSMASRILTVESGHTVRWVT